MSKLFERLEMEKVKEIADEYQKKGYAVYINPNMKSKLPDFLKNYQPDIYAFNDKENVIIEVKSRGSKFQNGFEKISEYIEDKPNWRLEVIFSNPKEKSILTSKNPLINEEEIQQRIHQMKSLVNSHYLEASFLLGWTILEAQLRGISKNEDLEENKSTLSLIKTLYSLGIIDEIDYKSIVNLFRTRNEIVHGYDMKIDESIINDMLNRINRLTKNIYVDSSKIEDF